MCCILLIKNYLFRPAMAIIRFFRKSFRRCYTVSVTAYWWGDLVISVPLFTGSVMISGGSMWKGRQGFEGVTIIKPRYYTTGLLGGRGCLCAFSGAAVSSLYATWMVPAGVAVPCGHHVYAGFSISVCFFLSASSLSKTMSSLLENCVLQQRRRCCTPVCMIPRQPLVPS